MKSVHTQNPKDEIEIFVDFMISLYFNKLNNVKLLG